MGPSSAKTGHDTCDPRETFINDVGGRSALSTMDPYSQLQEKLEDITQRFAHEARYFQVCAPPEAVSGEEVQAQASGPPFVETTESLAERAQISAHAIVALNLQVERLLESIPPEQEGGEEEQMAILDQLSRENQEAGAAVRLERDLVLKLLGDVRANVATITHRTSTPDAPPTAHPPWYPKPAPAAPPAAVGPNGAAAGGASGGGGAAAGGVAAGGAAAGAGGAWANGGAAVGGAAVGGGAGGGGVLPT
ncbi:hypothetical protein T484DRAFT_1894037, partial [Baffinella frigidus]